VEKEQILAAVVVAMVVGGVAVYRVLWAGSSSAAAVGLRRFPKTPGNLLRWIFGRRGDEKSDQAPRDTSAGPGAGE